MASVGVEESSSIFAFPPVFGKFHVLTGSNGTGKTRYLSWLSNKIAQDIKNGASEYGRMICLSGTVYEKFPKSFEDGSQANSDYIYFGNRTNNNMFSEISPFRRLALYLLNVDAASEVRMELARKTLISIGFDPVVALKFRRGRNTKNAESSNQDLDVTVNFQQGMRADQRFMSRYRQLLDGVVHLSGMTLSKSTKAVDLSNLSSGERLYILASLGLCFCTVDNTIVLFDEPENSLHPKWQAKLMQDLYSVISTVSVGSTVVIATHSPLVVSSAPNSDSLIRDLPSDCGWVTSDLYGKNSDAVLIEQFGVESPRALSVIDVIQRCLDSLVKGASGAQDFLLASHELQLLNLTLELDDPLYATVKMILQLRERAI